jgi:aspartyl-tRNA(Asn)/glutamyl-tRNA(Gln) amidotransferase subunit C
MSAAKITDDAVRHVARLASLALPEDELARMQRELDAILGFMQELETVDVSGVTPTFLAVPMNAPLRPDRVLPSTDRAELLSGAPASEAGGFAVPKVLDAD